MAHVLDEQRSRPRDRLRGEFAAAGRDQDVVEAVDHEGGDAQLAQASARGALAIIAASWRFTPAGW